MKRIKSTHSTAPRIKSTSATAELVSPEQVAAHLGAETVDEVAGGKGGMLTKAAIRQQLHKRLRSTGGRPALEGTDRRQKIPLSDEDWQRLVRLAQETTSDEAKPTPAQVASVLIHQVLNSLAS